MTLVANSTLVRASEWNGVTAQLVSRVGTAVAIRVGKPKKPTWAKPLPAGLGYGCLIGPAPAWAAS